MTTIIQDLKSVVKQLKASDKIVIHNGENNEVYAWGISIEEDKNGNKKLIILSD